MASSSSARGWNSDCQAVLLLEVGERLDLGGLREHVEGRDTLELKSGGQVRQVARECRRIAGNIQKGRDRMSAQNLAHLGTYPGGRRIDNHSR